MGYDVHITRANNWAANSGSQIDATEWMNVLQQDPDLATDPENGEFAAKYLKESEGWLDWFDGNIFTTNPTRPTVAKMLEIAQRLQAHVQGDEGEVYESAEQWRGEAAT